jgi:hypothetical protein
MHDYVLGFVCFMAGALFVLVVGFISLGRNPLGHQPEERADVVRPVDDLPPVEPEQQPRGDPQRPRREPERVPWHVTEHHPAWPECDCPTEAFHLKYYPTAGAS